MLKVWRYDIPLEDVFELEVPKNSEVLCVNTVNKSETPRPSIWFLVAPHCEETEKRKFIVRDTGHEIYEHSDYIKYLGTFFIVDRTLVFHVFEVVA